MYIPEVGDKVKLRNNEYVKSRLERPISNILMSPYVDEIGVVTWWKFIPMDCTSMKVEYEDGGVIYERDSAFELIERNGE